MLTKTCTDFISTKYVSQRTCDCFLLFWRATRNPQMIFINRNSSEAFQQFISTNCSVLCNNVSTLPTFKTSTYFIQLMKLLIAIFTTNYIVLISHTNLLMNIRFSFIYFN